MPPYIYASYLYFLNILTILAMAAPIDKLNTLRCHCMTFYAHSAPAACTLAGAHNLDWHTAQGLASLHNLDVEFASQESATKVLQVASPLSTSVLMGMQTFQEPERVRVGTKMVCGVGDEVSRMFVQTPDERMGASIEAQDARVSGVLAVLVLGVVLYAIAECLWERYSDKGRGIQLAGEEKVLTAGVHVGDSGDEQHVFQEKEKKGYGPETQLPDDLPDSSWGP